MTKPCKKCGSTDRLQNGNCRNCNRINAREWRIKNKERVRLYNKTRNSSWNQARNRENAKTWTKRNRNYAQNRRAKLLGVKGSFSSQEWTELCFNHNNKCVKCAKKLTPKSLVPDHIKPISKGGSNFITNIQPMCNRCNSLKHTSEVDYRKKAGRLQLSFEDSL